MARRPDAAARIVPSPRRSDDAAASARRVAANPLSIEPVTSRVVPVPRPGPRSGRRLHRRRARDRRPRRPVRSLDDDRSERRLHVDPGGGPLHRRRRGRRVRTGLSDRDRAAATGGPTGIRAAAGRHPRSRDGQRARGLPGSGDYQRDQDADTVARRAAVGHRDHSRVDAGPPDVGSRRRGALPTRRHRPSGRKQPRSGRHSRQHLVRGLFSQWHPRRCPVLPGPVQRRSRRGAEGSQRDDVRPWRRRRCGQSGDQGRGVHTVARNDRAGGLAR